MTNQWRQIAFITLVVLCIHYSYFATYFDHLINYVGFFFSQSGFYSHRLHRSIYSLVFFCYYVLWVLWLSRHTRHQATAAQDRSHAFHRRVEQELARRHNSMNVEPSANWGQHSMANSFTLQTQTLCVHLNTILLCRQMSLTLMSWPSPAVAQLCLSCCLNKMRGIQAGFS